METVNIHEAKTHLSKLIDRVTKGRAVILAKAGKPVAKLVPLDVADEVKPKRLGFMAGEFRVPDDFDRMGEGEIETLFDGSR